MSKFYDEIKNAKIERQIEDVYNKYLENSFGKAPINYPYACDGYMEWEDLKLLIEYKFDKNFESALDRAKVLIQVIFYLKQFELEGKELPNVIMVADINECFLLHSNCIVKYLDYDLDWKIAPSKAHEKYIDVCLEISKDPECNSSFVYDIDSNFEFKTLVESIKNLVKGVKRFIHITESNIENIYEVFNKKVLSSSAKISDNNKVGLFIGVISDKTNYYLHPTKKSTLVSPYGEIKIKTSGFNQFTGNFSRTYSPVEKRKFTEISDRLIENTNRRNKGEFYTPKPFVDCAQGLIEQQLGKDWREKYVVWDNCCGTKNLTKDYKFKELYCSTLEDAELKMSEKYNPEAVSFQFDFLNDDLSKLPQGLQDALGNNKPILFFFNPPYATGGSGIGKSKQSGTTTSSKINSIMKIDKIGACSENLYAQFLYRTYLIKKQYNLTNCRIGFFSPTLYLSGGSWKKFREIWLKEFKYEKGFVFQASHFSNCSKGWGISFSFWTSGETVDKENFKHDLVDGDNSIIKFGEKNIYNLDNTKSASEWEFSYKSTVKTYNTFALSSSINIIKDDSKIRGKYINNCIGFILNGGNSVSKNITHSSLFSWNYSNGHGHGILNLEKTSSLFTARRLITPNWINDKDEYMVPDTTNPKWNQFVADSVVYSLFNTSSNQSSLRNVEYKGKTWDIKNEFFWLSKDEILQLSNDNDLEETYEDCVTSQDRFVYTWLETHKSDMSPKADSVLKEASDLLRASMKYREPFNDLNEEYQIFNWDCGWYQVKAMLKQFMPGELKTFNEHYKELADQLRPLVYELGFLKK